MGNTKGELSGQEKEAEDLVYPVSFLSLRIRRGYTLNFDIAIMSLGCKIEQYLIR